jgi:predicted O-methyltransferase YrrM
MSFSRFLPKYLKGLATSAYLFTFGLAKPANRLFIHEFCRRFGWRVDEFPPELPRVSAAQFLRDGIEVQLSQLATEAGNISLTELAVIAAICAARRPASIFEIGTFDGRTTLNLAENSPVETIVYTLDLPADQMRQTKFVLAAGEEEFVRKPLSGGRFAGSPDAARIRQLHGDSAQFDFSPFQGQIDLIFVDGSHAYEYVANDSRAALDMIRPGGMVIWHDYGSGDWPGVNRALDELRRDNPKCAGMQWIEGTTLAILQVSV